ncbi:PhoH family protein [Elusimicrobiota bacterium]
MSENDQIYNKTVKFETHDEAFNAFGEYDMNIKRLEAENSVEIFTRGMKATVRGRESDVEMTINQLISYKSIMNNDRSSHGGHCMDAILKTPLGKQIKALTPKQAEYVQAMQKKDLVVAIGPAGTGKTFLACVRAVQKLNSGKVDRVILTRPLVESGEKLGYLPGDLHEKVDPYLRPLYDAFYTLLGAEKFQRLKKDNIIEIVPLAYMRGRTFDNAMIVLDEAQNTSSNQMKMFLTRLGFNSQVVITGDITQIDLEEGKTSGLIEIDGILQGIKEISFIYFQNEDVVRHRLVKQIVDAYNKFKKNI